MQIIDGYCNEPNIFADDIGEYNTAIWGTRDCVLPAGERLGYELVSNNEIKIKDGVFSTQGRRGVIKKGTTESCIIENGTQAENRNDLIVIEYAKDSSTLVESHTLKVIKGTPGETATDPDVVTGDIQAGDVLHQMPLYRVKLEGLNVVAVERLFSVGNNAIGKEFDPDKDYEIGDLTLQYNKAWKFKVKHLAGAWDESQMEETDVLTELAEQNKNFGNLTFAQDADGNWGYKVGGADPVIPFKQGGVKLLTSITGDGAINITSYVTTDYKKLTVDNFIVESYYFPKAQTVNTSGGNRSAGAALGATLSKSYDQSTGILTVSGLSQLACLMDNTTNVRASVIQKFSAKIYMVN